MKSLITGAGGFVGRFLIENLLEHGYELVACSHRPFDDPPEALIEVFDITSTETTAQVIGKHLPDLIIHLAAQASVRKSWVEPAATYETNVVGTSNLLHSMAKRTDTRVLIVGSGQEYGSADIGRPFLEDDPLRPASPYAASKVAQEYVGMLYFHEFGMPVVASRSFNHTGPGQSPEYAVASFSRQIAEIESEKRPPRLEVGRLDTVRDFLDVRDVVDAYRLLAEAGTPGQCYHVCSGQGVPMREILDILLEVAGLSGRVEIVEESFSRSGDAPRLVGDNSKITSELGWTPSISLKESLISTLDWYRERVN